LKTTGGFGPVHQEILESGRLIFDSERVSDDQTRETIKSIYEQVGYVLDPHSAVGVAAARRSINKTGLNMPHISLSTAHPAKFSDAIKLALGESKGFDYEKDVLPEEFIQLEKAERRVVDVENSWQTVREIIKKQVEEDLKIEGGH
jgi:threonine synthase